jgi:outer membrane protein OmpA-like peptidoglycan-associated protein
MKKILTFFLFSFLTITFIFSQQYEEILRDVFLDAEFFLLEESYVDALQEYQKLYNRGYENNANINYRIGICYLNIPGEKEKSIPYLEKAIKNVTPKYKEGIFNETQAPYDSWLYLGNAYRINNELDKATTAYQKYKELLDNDKSEMAKYADQQITACNNAKKAQENPVYYIKENLGETINTEYSDFNPVLSADEKIMVFMTSLKFYDAVKCARKVNGEWTEPVNITPEIQSDGNQYANCLSKDGTELYLNVEDNFNSDIYHSSYENERWNKSKPLNKNINTRFWESHASISSDGEYLYFASNKRGGFGGMDIYVSQKDEYGEWGEPVNLGPGINTELNEDHPFLSQDGKVLYFVSQGHYNIGGYDIFFSEQIRDGTWREPINLGYPINTTDDDLFFYPLDNGKYGYQALFADDSYGSRDIYRFQLFESKEEYLTATTQMTQEVEEVVEEVVEEAVEEAVEKVEEVIPEPEAKIFVIRAIFFKFDDYSLTSQAKSKLENLADIMNTYKELHILASGHTDAIGPDSYNMTLSRRRANSAVEYLKSQGIASDRMQIKALGETDHVAINSNPDGSDNPEGRKLNRRVEFQVIKPDLPNVKIEPVPVPENLKIK